MSRILQLEPDSQPQNLRAKLEKLEQVTYRSNVETAESRFSTYGRNQKWAISFGRNRN